MVQQGRKIVSKNKKAWHEYFIEETYDAGICLSGTEVKSIRAGHASFQDSYAKVENGEVWLLNMFIAPYEQGNRFNLDPKRPRKLLMHKIEIQKLAEKTQQKGLTLVPLQLYFERGFAKLELGLGKGKKLYDKREALAEKDAAREALRSASERY